MNAQTQLKPIYPVREQKIDDKHWEQIQKMFREKKEMDAYYESARRAKTRYEKMKAARIAKREKIAAAIVYGSISLTIGFIIAMIYMGIDKATGYAMSNDAFYSGLIVLWLVSSIITGALCEYVENTIKGKHREDKHKKSTK